MQGEQIQAFLASTELAVHTFQSYAISVLEHTISPPKLPTDAQRELMQQLADASAKAFQAQVYQSEDGIFSRYFHAATPTSALASMNLGSRPAKAQINHTLNANEARAAGHSKLNAKAIRAVLASNPPDAFPAAPPPAASPDTTACGSQAGNMIRSPSRGEKTRCSMNGARSAPDDGSPPPPGRPPSSRKLSRRPPAPPVAAPTSAHGTPRGSSKTSGATPPAAGSDA